jgi:hypothetical protein
MAYIGNAPAAGSVTGDNIVDGTIDTADIKNGAVTAAKLGSGAAVSNIGYTPVSIDSNNLLFRNRIINGDMRIDQRNGGEIFSPPPNQGYSLDRWTTWLSQNTFSVQRNAGSVTPPAGFTNYLGVTATSATTIGVSDYFGVGHKVEGFNIADLGWGAANAQSATISFWVRSSITGNFGAVIRNNDGSQYYAFTYSVSAANTWEYKTIVIPGPTSGNWNTTNGTGLFLLFGFGAGANQTASSNGTWISGGVLGAAGATPLVATGGATWQITGVQLEAGSVATPFERRPYGTELMLCKRYYQEDIGDNDEMMPLTMNYGTAFVSGNYRWITVSFPVEMRATPTVTFYPDGGFKTNPGKARYLTGTGSGAGNVLTPYGSGSTSKMLTLKSYNEYAAFTCFGFLAGYAASAEL